jgi:energy-coupling factor transporter ATP-binding protein EcfA2
MAGGCRRTTAILAFLLASLTSLTASLNCNIASNTNTPSTNLHVRFLPSQVEFQQVSQQYPETLARRLFSSVPRREFALHNVSFTLQSELTLLTGASSSGKSALMKIISGIETPTQGYFHIQCLWDAPILPKHHAPWVAQPVYLDQRPSIDSRRTARQILCQQEESILQKLLLGSKGNKPKQQSDSSSSLRNFLKSLLKALTVELCSCLQLTSATITLTTMTDNSMYDAWMDQTTLQLSSSQSYRLALVTACLQSSMANLSAVLDSCADVDIDILFPMTDAIDTTERQLRTVSVPAPILLLDEWMDTETTEIIQTVQRGLEQLAGNSGAVIVSATHKAERWKKPYSEMVLSRGQVLSRNRIES